MSKKTKDLAAEREALKQKIAKLEKSIAELEKQLETLEELKANIEKSLFTC